MPAPQTRINARLDADHRRKLEFLRERTQAGTTELVKRGIDAYYLQVKSEEESARSIFKKTGLIGCAVGPGDLSQRYKELLSTGLANKHGSR